jgi:DNA-binding MarR family transcriptional regulator
MRQETRVQPPELESRILARLLHVAPLLVALSERGSSEYGLTYARGRVVAALHDSGPMVMRALSEALEISPRTVTELVDALERDGWVTRGRHPTDRRATLVELASDRVGLYRKLERQWRELAEVLLSDTDVEQLEQTLELLNKLESRLRGADPAASANAPGRERSTHGERLS